MMDYRKTIGVALLGSLLAAPAGATVAYNASLASPNTLAADPAANTSTNNSSWFNGNGNPQGGWTVTTVNGIELGLRAKQRGTNTIYWNSGNLYYVPLGSDGSHAIWNYEFSIDVRPGGGVGTPTLDDFLISLTVADSHGNINTVDPVSHWHDSSYYGSATGSDNTPSPTPPPTTGLGKHVGDFAVGDWDTQNSENPMFGDFPLAGSFDPNQQGTYTFTLEVRDQDNNLLASDSMIVSTPEPATLSVLGFSCLGLLAVRRRKA